MQASCSSADADRPITDGLNTDLYLDISNGISLEKVDKLLCRRYVGCRWRMLLL